MAENYTIVYNGVDYVVTLGIKGRNDEFEGRGDTLNEALFSLAHQLEDEGI